MKVDPLLHFHIRFEIAKRYPNQSVYEFMQNSTIDLLDMLIKDIDHNFKYTLVIYY